MGRFLGAAQKFFESGLSRWSAPPNAKCSESGAMSRSTCTSEIGVGPRKEGKVLPLQSRRSSLQYLLLVSSLINRTDPTRSPPPLRAALTGCRRPKISPIPVPARPVYIYKNSCMRR